MEPDEGSSGAPSGIRIPRMLRDRSGTTSTYGSGSRHWNSGSFDTDASPSSFDSSFTPPTPISFNFGTSSSSGQPSNQEITNTTPIHRGAPGDDSPRITGHALRDISEISEGTVREEAWLARSNPIVPDIDLGLPSPGAQSHILPGNGGPSALAFRSPTATTWAARPRTAPSSLSPLPRYQHISSTASSPLATRPPTPFPDPSSSSSMNTSLPFRRSNLKRARSLSFSFSSSLRKGRISSSGKRLLSRLRNGSTGTRDTNNNGAPELSVTVTPADESEWEADQTQVEQLEQRAIDAAIVTRAARSASLPLPNMLPTTRSPSPGGKIRTQFSLNLFDFLLPRELRLWIFATLFNLYIDNLREQIVKQEWTGASARWSGAAGGMRELVKNSGVSKTWQINCLDGTLWSALEIDQVGWNNISPTGLRRIFSTAGPFIRRLDLQGFPNLRGDELRQLVHAMLRPRDGHATTNLVKLNLAGSRALSSENLEHLLDLSPNLRDVTMEGLDAVTSSAIQCLVKATALQSLDVRRCRSMDAASLLLLGRPLSSFDDMSRSWGSILAAHPLNRLLVAACPGMDDHVFAHLAHHFPNLQALEFSYTNLLSDKGIRRFVEPRRDEPRVSMPSSESIDSKRLTALKSLVLTGNQHLTDLACDYLSRTTPHLQSLEMASLPRLRDSGLVKLLRSTPELRRLDIGDSEVGDATLAALSSHPDSLLEHLCLARSTELTEQAISSLVENCVHLRVLEVDSITLSDDLVKQFVQVQRERGQQDAELNAVDCRGITKAGIHQLSQRIKPRHAVPGWRQAPLDYRSDRIGRHGILLDEYNADRVVVKSFFSWSLLDQTAPPRTSESTGRWMMARLLRSRNASTGEGACIIS